MAFNIDSADSKIVESGIWATYKGSEFLIAHTSSLRYQRELSRLQQPHRKRIEKGTLDPETMLDILVQSMVNALLLDWRNVVDNTGADIPFNKEIATRVIKTDQEFREWLIETADNFDNYRVEEVEEAVK